MVMRQGGTLESGVCQPVYSADMRHSISLQFYPDGYDYVESDPTPLSQGYSSHKVLPLCKHKL